jgi:hypothetical protein
MEPPQPEFPKQKFRRLKKYGERSEKKILEESQTHGKKTQ